MSSPYNKEQIPAIYAKAIQRYEEITHDKLNVEFLTRLRTVDDLTAVVDQRNNNFAEFRGKRRAIFDAMSSCLAPFQQFSNITSTAIAGTFPPSGLLFSVVNQLIGAANGVASSYDAIQDLMSTLKVGYWYLLTFPSFLFSCSQWKSNVKDGGIDER